MVHNEEQAALYIASCRNTNIDPSRILVSNTTDDVFGLTRQREWVCSYADKGEWFLFADDNIRTIQAVTQPSYQYETLPVQERPDLRPIYEAECEPARFMKEIVPECKKHIEKLSAQHCGFATTDNFYFRAAHWRKSAYIIGKMMLWHNTHTLQFDHTITIEIQVLHPEYVMAADAPKPFNKVLVQIKPFKVALQSRAAIELEKKE